jgi:serine/threonine protein kinase
MSEVVSFTENDMRELHMLSVGVTPTAFEFLRLAGHGSNGCVFIVKCTLRGFPFPDKLYALKMVFNLHHLSTSSRKSLYEAEFTLFASLPPSPYIVRSFGVFHGQVPGPALAMLSPETQALLLTDEYGLPWDSVRSTFGIFEAHPFTLLSWRKTFGLVIPFSEYVPKCRDLLLCAIAMMERGLAHRDMKPDNVLVKADGSLCVCDIGEAVHLVRAPAFATIRIDFRVVYPYPITQTDGDWKVVINQGQSAGGNQAHMAPEVLNALRPLANPRTRSVIVDYSKQAVFETGVMLCELAVLKHAVPGYPAFVSSPPPVSLVAYDHSAICPWLSGGRCLVLSFQ